MNKTENIGGTADLHLTYHVDEEGLSFVLPLQNNPSRVVQVHGGGYNEPTILTYSLNDYILNPAGFSHTPTLIEAFLESIDATVLRQGRLRKLQEAVDDMRAVFEDNLGTGSDEGADAADALLQAAKNFLADKEITWQR